MEPALVGHGAGDSRLEILFAAREPKVISHCILFLLLGFGICGFLLGLGFFFLIWGN
jgi:hypothetical protein